jgi:hypothetical protein
VFSPCTSVCNVPFSPLAALRIFALFTFSSLNVISFCYSLLFISLFRAGSLNFSHLCFDVMPCFGKIAPLCLQILLLSCSLSLLLGLQMHMLGPFRCPTAPDPLRWLCFCFIFFTLVLWLMKFVSLGCDVSTRALFFRVCVCVCVCVTRN